MSESLRAFVDTLRSAGPWGVFEIALLTLAIWSLLLFARGTTAMSLLRGIGIVLISALALANFFDLPVLNWLLRNSLTGLILMVSIVFQPEIRRGLERVGRTGLHAIRGREADEALISILTNACSELARRRHGALIVLERETGLEEYIRAGRRLDAAPSEALIEAIFFRNAPLHDGALIVRGDQLAAAACTLPLSEALLPQQYGTRHRAALGITERTDALSIVVSEETGDLALACDGRLTAVADAGALRAGLSALLGASASATPATVADRRHSDARP